MGDDRGEALTPVPLAADDDAAGEVASGDKRPSGLPPAKSTARRLGVDAEPVDAEPVDAEPVDGARVRAARSGAAELDVAPADARGERRDPTPVTRLRPPRSGRPPAAEAESTDAAAQSGTAQTGAAQPPSPSPSGEREGSAATSPSSVGEREASAPAAPRSRSSRPPAAGKKAPEGLKNMTTSARRRLQLAFDDDEDEDEDDEAAGKDGLGAPARRIPPGLRDTSPSARLRLQLALDADIDEMEAIRPPRVPSSQSMMAVGHIPFDEDARRVVASLSRWVAFCGFLTLAVGALTGLSYLTGPGSVAHVVVGILATALAVWLLAAGWSFRRVLTQKRQQHHLINGLGLLRSALLLKTILLFSGMVLGCFTFSIATALLFLL